MNVWRPVTYMTPSVGVVGGVKNVRDASLMIELLEIVAQHEKDKDRDSSTHRRRSSGHRKYRRLQNIYKENPQ